MAAWIHTSVKLWNKTLCLIIDIPEWNSLDFWALTLDISKLHFQIIMVFHKSYKYILLEMYL